MTDNDDTTQRDLGRVEGKVDSLQTDVNAIKDTLSTLVDKLDNRYASKWTERAVYGVISLTVAALLYAAITTLVPAASNMNGTPSISTN